MKSEKRADYDLVTSRKTFYSPQGSAKALQWSFLPDTQILQL